MKTLIVFVLLLSAPIFADTFHSFTVRNKDVTCSVDVRISSKGKITKEVLCFLTK